MRNFLILFLLIYCNTFDFIGANLTLDENKEGNGTSFFNFISRISAQSVGREHQNVVCKKLRAADFNNDHLVDEADYSFLYLVAMKEHNALEQLQETPQLEELMDLTVQKLSDSKNRQLANTKGKVDDQDVTLFTTISLTIFPTAHIKISKSFMKKKLALKAKAPLESQIEMREMVLPQHTNAIGSIFGGVIMSWIDLAAAMCAQKHCEKHVVTVHIEELSFLSPIKVGEHVLIKASINYAGTTSMIIGVRVESENPITKEHRLTTRAYLTFVAIDLDGKPTPVPPLQLKTPEDKRRYENAQKRDSNRKKMRTILVAKTHKS